MYSVLVSDNSQHKKAQNVGVKMLKEKVIKKMFCWTGNVWGIRLIELKIIE